MIQQHDERRAHPRFSMDSDALVDIGGARFRGVVSDLSLSGAFLTGVERGAHEGDGLQLTLRLANNMPVVVRGQVVRVTPEGAGVRFYSLSATTTRVLDDYFKGRAASPARESDGTVELETCYRVIREGRDRVNIQLSGFLGGDDCEHLSAQIGTIMRTLESEHVFVCIDATEYQCCAVNGLPTMRDGLSTLGRRPTIAALVGNPRSLGIIQLRRVARDAGIADLIASFDGRSEAVTFLSSMAAEMQGNRSSLAS